MFYLDNTLALSKQPNSRWSTDDLSQVTMGDLYDQYAEAYFGIHYNIGNTPQPTFWVSLSTLKANGFSLALNLTLELFLMGLSSSTPIPHDSSVLPVVTTVNAEFANGWQAGYDVQRIPYYGAIDAPQPLGIKTDLLVTRMGTDYDMFASNCLVTINGLFHASSLIPGTGIRVKAGGRSVDICEDNRIGVYSFLEMGGLTIIPITDDMFFKPDSLMTNVSETYLSVGMDLTGKSVMMVLGGYLHVNDNSYRVTARQNGVVKVMLKNVELVKRLFESRQFIDLSSLNLTVHPNNPDAIKMSDLVDDDVIKAYLKLSQSFIVVVNQPTLYSQKNMVEHAQLPGVFYSPTQPLYPLVLTTGIVSEYVAHLNDGLWILNAKNNLKPNYQFTTTNYESMPWVIPDTIYDRPFEWAVGDLLEIGSESILNLHPV